jgi:hypothetical protein
MANGYGTAKLDTADQSCAKKDEHWIEVELVGRDDKPIAWEKYAIKLPDGTTSTGRLDAFGWIRIDGIKPGGMCQVSFPELDTKVWQPIESTAARPAPGPVKGKARNTSWYPDAGSSITVKEGQCCTSVAYAEGHLWQSIWDAAENKALRKTRDDPNCLMPGDSLYVPELTKKEEARPTDQRHRFRLMAAAKLVIMLTYPHGEPRKGARYELTVGDLVVKDTTADGKINVVIVPSDTKGKLLVYGDGTVTDQTFEFRLGTLNPYNEVQGVQQRFRNLGSRRIEVNNQNNESTTTAVRGFQRGSGKAATGAAADVQTDLRNQHGS